MGGTGSGVEKFSPDINDIKDVAVKLRGNIRSISKHFNVSRQTIYQYLHRTPDGMDVLKLSRSHTHEDFIDVAEFVTMYNMNNYKENPSLAQAAANKVIDKKGHSRGWLSEKDQQDADPQSKAQFGAIMDQLSSLQSKKINSTQSSDSSLRMDDNINNSDA